MPKNQSFQKRITLGGLLLMVCGVSSQVLQAQVSRDANANQAANSQVYYVAGSEFDIPFDVSPTGRQPKEVQLEFSTDRGTRWQLFSKQPVSRDRQGKRSFTFRAPADGLYLFRLTTLDEGGNPFPSNDAPMAIVVDSSQPLGEMEINLDASGQLVATFSVVDANLNTDTIQLEYLPENNQQWIPVEIQWTDSRPTRVEGQAVWDVAPSIRRMVVRLVGADQAGNKFEIIRSPEVPRTATNSGGMQLASQRQGPQVPRSTPSPTFTQSAPVPGRPVYNPYVSTTPTGGKPPSAGATDDSQLQIFPSVRPWQHPGAAAAPKVQPSQVDANGSYVLQQLPTVPPGIPTSTKSVAPPSAQQKTTPAMELADEAPTIPGVEPYYSESKTFSLDYALDADTVTAVTAVELWGTVDGGKTWDHWDNDPDRTSPFDIQVEEDGLFGFRMVIVNANGLSGSSPRSGEDPDVWVHVDTQLPTARILSALYGKGQEAGSLVIEFSCDDNLFGDRPISLYLSESQQGPWTTIAAGLPNTGRYVWRADPNMPRKIYLKIEAVDQAGNVGSHVGDIPVDVQGLAPRGRFQGFRPINSGR